MPSKIQDFGYLLPSAGNSQGSQNTIRSFSIPEIRIDSSPLQDSAMTSPFMKSSQSVRGNTPPSRSAPSGVHPDGLDAKLPISQDQGTISPATADQQQFIHHSGNVSSESNMSDASNVDRQITRLKSTGILEQVLEAGLAAINNSKSTPMSRSASWSPGRSEVNGTQFCPRCPKTTNQPRDLRKHMKRHERLYHCTAHPSCSKTFGSKSDWKRHEATIHSHTRRWVCQESRLHPAREWTWAMQGGKMAGPCGEVFDQSDLFKNHLHHTHNILSKEEVNAKVLLAQQSSEESAPFWCGFCKEFLDLDKTNSQSIDDGLSSTSRSTSRQSRVATDHFEHIDQHIKGEDRIAWDKYWEGYPQTGLDQPSNPMTPTTGDPEELDDEVSGLDFRSAFDISQDRYFDGQVNISSQSSSQSQDQSQQPMYSRKGKEKEVEPPTPVKGLCVFCCNCSNLSFFNNNDNDNDNKCGQCHSHEFCGTCQYWPSEV